MDAECDYHPAPLTRPTKRIRMSSSDHHEAQSTEVSAWDSTVAPLSNNNRDQADTFVNDNNPSSHPLESARVPDNTPTGALPSLLSLQGLDDANTRHVVHAAVYDDCGNKTHEGDVLSIAQILNHVQHCVTIKKLVTEY